MCCWPAMWRSLRLKDQIGDELRSGKLDVFYDLYNTGQQRRFERYQYALKVLERPMDFTGNDNFNLDRSKAPWPKDEAELNKLWDAKVKFDQLSLKLAGKDDKEIRDTLTRRYKFAIRRPAQTNSEDVFSLAMTAFAREIDPHTNYLSPRNTEQFNTEMSLSLEGSAPCCRWMMTIPSLIRWWRAVQPRKAKRSASAIASLALARPGSRWLMSSAGVWMTSWR